MIKSYNQTIEVMVKTNILESGFGERKFITQLTTAKIGMVISLMNELVILTQAGMKHQKAIEYAEVKLQQF